MGKPRKKGMRRGYLKRYSSAMLNGGMYGPHKPSMAEMKRRPQSLGNINHRSLAVTDPQPLPPTIGMSKERAETKLRWELFTHNARNNIKLEEVHVAREIKTQRDLYKLCFLGSRGGWFWFHKDLVTEERRRSITYRSSKRAMEVFVDNIVWRAQERNSE